MSPQPELFLDGASRFDINQVFLYFTFLVEIFETCFMKMKVLFLVIICIGLSNKYFWLKWLNCFGNLRANLETVGFKQPSPIWLCTRNFLLKLFPSMIKASQKTMLEYFTSGNYIFFPKALHNDIGI